MATDLDQLLTASLRARADAGSPIDPQPLLHTAVTRGRALRTRRRVLAAVVAAAAVAGLTTATIGLPGRNAAPPTGPVPSPSPSVFGVPDADLDKMPEAPGRPGAAARPDLVATDPGVVHFSVDALAAASSSVRYRSGPGFESVAIERRAGAVLMVLGPSEEVVSADGSGGIVEAPWSGPLQVLVQGRKAIQRISRSWRTNGVKMYVFSYVWQPVEGLWARFEAIAAGPDEARRVFDLIRLDQARRCVLPIRVAGGTVVECEVGLQRPGIFGTGSMTIADGSKRLVIEARAVTGGPPRPERPVDDRSGWLSLGGMRVWYRDAGTDRFTTAELASIIGGLRPAGNLADPRTW